MREYLKTGVPNLDRLLDMDDSSETPGGILIADIDEKEGEAGATTGASAPPVTLIAGEAGTGKTTLVLQIASNLRETRDVYLYSLEQTAPELNLACRHFGFSAGPLYDLAQADLPPAGDKGIKLCHFTPLPSGAADGASVFEERLLQLAHVIQQVKARRPQPQLVFFLDSLNALGLGDLRRHDVYRLFALFRAHKIPAFVTCEAGKLNSPEVEGLAYSARFLADIVIDLRKESREEYVLFNLEISKNRRSRQALGKHLYKTRTVGNADRVQQEAGVTVYPSIHAVLSMARERQRTTGTFYQITDGSGSDLFEIMQAKTISAGCCVAVTGPRGTHKRALALNLATGHKKSTEGEARRLLVLSFGVYGGFNFKGTAWFQERSSWRNLEQKPPDDPSEVKAWMREYVAPINPDHRASVITFQVGNLAPEECFNRVEKCISQPGAGFSAVLLCDTAEICTGFPLLRSDPLFLPTLIDLIHSYELLSIAVGVGSAGKYGEEMDASLLAIADYRVTLSQYPSTYQLSESIVERELSRSGTQGLTEQAACVIVDNVSGQHYGRVPRWLWVKPDREVKQLFCGSIESYLARA